jgi:hypothetical protein
VKLKVAVAVALGPLHGFGVERAGAIKLPLSGEDHRQHEPLVGVAAVADRHGAFDHVAGGRQVADAVFGEGQGHERTDAARLGLAVVDLLRGHLNQPSRRLERDFGLANLGDRAEQTLPGRVLEDGDVVGGQAHRLPAKVHARLEMRGRLRLLAMQPELGAQVEMALAQIIPARGRRPLGQQLLGGLDRLAICVLHAREIVGGRIKQRNADPDLGSLLDDPVFTFERFQVLVIARDGLLDDVASGRDEIRVAAEIGVRQLLDRFGDPVEHPVGVVGGDLGFPPGCRRVAPSQTERFLGGVVRPADQEDRGGEHDDREHQGDQGRGDERRVPAPPLHGPVPGRGRLGQDRLVVEESPQVVGHLLGRRVAALDLPAHRFLEDRLQLARHLRVDPPGWNRVVVGDPSEDLLVRRARDGVGQRRVFVEGRRQRVDVGPMVDERLPPERLLGAHVAERAEQVAGDRQPPVLADSGQTEVRDPKVAALVDHQVRGLDVAVDDPLPMGVFQGERGLQPQLRDRPVVIGPARCRPREPRVRRADLGRRRL